MSTVTRSKVPEGVRREDVDYFSTIPLARRTLADPTFQIIAMSRTMTHNGTGHTLMAGTWNTDDTISHLLSFYRPPPAWASDPVGSESKRAECRRLYSFGHMMNAHPETLHGGVVACILDSTMGNVIGAAVRDCGTRYTAQLNVSYKAPVRTPGTVMARSWIRKVEDGGRKIWVEGVVEGGQDGEVMHAKAEGLWVRAKDKATRL